MTHHQRGIQVNHHTRQVTPGRPSRRERLTGELGALRPHDLPGRCSGPRDRTQPRGVELREQPPARRVRRHRPEHGGLIGQHRDIEDRGRAIGDRDRHVHHHPTGIVAGPALAQPAQLLAELAGQGGLVRDVGEQPGPRMRHHAFTVGGCGDLR